MKNYLFAAVAILLFSCAFKAQTPTPDVVTQKDKASLESFTINVKSAGILCENNSAVKRLKVVFDQTIREIYRVSTIIGKPAFSERYQQDALAYHLINLTTGKQVPLDSPSKPIADDLNFLVFTLNESTLAETDKFDKSRKYSLLVRGLKLEKGAPTENATMTSIEVSSSCEDMPKELGKAAEITDKSPPSIYEYAKEKIKMNKTKPEVKVGFAMNGERVTSPFYETSIAAEPFELKRLGLLGAYSIVPFFLNLEKNDSPGSEVDKLNFGGKFKHLFVFNDDGKYSSNRLKASPLMGIKSEVSLRIETTTKFKTGNVVLGLKSGLPFNLFQTRSQSMRLTPFVGFDLGYKVLNENSTNKEKWIMRPSFGAEFYYTPFRNEKDVPVLIEASYIRRTFLRPEEIYTRNADRKPIIEGLTTNPKDFFSLQLTFWQTKFISPFIKYTYGRDLTQYLFENHKYRVGVQANFDWGDKK